MTLPDGIIVTGDIDKIQILNYSIATENGSYFDYEKIADGFVYSENASRYKINGSVKNIAGEMLGNVKVYVEFYDSNDTYLDSEYDYKYDLPDGYIWDFEVTYSKYQDYFEYVDHIGFDISV